MTACVMVPLDGSPLAEQALPYALAFARPLGAPLMLARVPEPVAMQVPGADAFTIADVESPESLAAAERYLAAVAARPELAGVAVQTIAPHHPVAEGILRAIGTVKPRLVVLTTHGRSGLRRAAVGSVASKLVHHAPVPVCVVRAAAAPPGDVAPPRRILVPLDGSRSAEAVLPGATALAKAVAATLVLVRVPTVPGYATVIPETAGWVADLLRDEAIEATLYLETLARPLVDEGLEVVTDVEIVGAGSIAEGILAAADEHAADLVMMSTRGLTGFRRWMLGSVADEVVRHTTLPVWLVRAGDEDPATG